MPLLTDIHLQYALALTIKAFDLNRPLAERWELTRQALRILEHFATD